LVGPPGAGKSTIGALLAGQLGTDFRDTDSDIEARTQKSIGELFLDEGEDAFRELETRAVAEALASHDGVLALGGGAVLAEQTRAVLAGQRVVYLSVELADAVRRTGMDSHRPLLALNPRATLRALLDARRPLYTEVAWLTVGTDGREPDQIVTEILAALESASGARS
jgi:shikimate kinase